nr:hypothetical protein [uncultured Fluviicola sp.]
MKSTVENIYGDKIKIERIPSKEKSVLIVTSGGTCHDCQIFVLDEAVKSDRDWFLLYIVDGDGKLSISAKRDIINSIKNHFGNNTKLLDDKRIYFLPKSRFCREITKFPIVLKSNKEWVPYERIWNAMNKEGSIF